MPSSYGPGYETWVHGVLGKPLPPRKWFDNPITGAVAGGSGQFTFFVERFRERLLRLWAALPNDHDKLLEKVANVGTENWYGYFAELTAWDFFADLPLGLEIEVAPPGPQLGPTRCILDGRLRRTWNLHFDVKALADTTKMVLEGIERQLKADFPGTAFRFSYPLDLGKSAVADVRQDLIDGIRKAIQQGQPHLNHAASRVHVHVYNPPPSVTTTEHSYNPYEQAKELRLSIVSDAKQFIRGDRNVLVLVVHPWFNLTNTNNFGGQQHVFFRALARRAFCELTKDQRPLIDVVGRAPAGVTVQEAAEHLSGIVFLVDHSVTGRAERDPSKILGVIEGFIYVNPNAAKDSDGHLQLEQVVANASGLLSVFDDFRHDNY
jgi:hypothetical protein